MQIAAYAVAISVVAVISAALFFAKPNQAVAPDMLALKVTFQGGTFTRIITAEGSGFKIKPNQSEFTYIIVPAVRDKAKGLLDLHVRRGILESGKSLDEVGSFELSRDSSASITSILPFKVELEAVASQADLKDSNFQQASYRATQSQQCCVNCDEGYVCACWVQCMNGACCSTDRCRIECDLYPLED